MKGGPFNFVGGLRPKRYFYNLSHSKLFACDFGELIPAFWEECLPGDKFKLSNQIVIRTQPLFSPLLQEIKVYTEYFFVPTRLLWDDWQNFLTGGKDGTLAPELPTISPTGTLLNRFFVVNTLPDYFGCPVNVVIGADDDPLAFPFYAYNMIWNEYYRDENYDDEVSLNNLDVLRRRWRKDYFTSVLPSQQRGIAPGFFLRDSDFSFSGQISSQDVVFSTRTTDVYGKSILSYYNNDLASYYKPSVSSTSTYYVNPFCFAVGSSVSRYDIEGKRLFFQGDSPNNGYTLETVNKATPTTLQGEASFGAGFDVSYLRLMFQIQKFLERNMRSGYRLNEFLLAHFGISPRDSVLQRPEYIGGTRSNLLVSEVLQTSESTESSPQGSLAGRGLGVSGDYVNTYTCSEHGYIIGMFSVMPTNLYSSQGFDKRLSRKTRYDFYFPEFSHLSEQPVYQNEIFYDSGTDNEIFGYQPIYQEYRHRRSSVHSYFRPEIETGIYKEYTLARSFSSRPEMGSDFIECNPDSSRVFPVNSIKPLLVNIANICKALRPVTVYSDPGLIDHF